MEETNVTNQADDKEIIETSTPVETAEDTVLVDIANYATLDTEDLIEAVKTLVDTAPIQTIKAQIDEAKKIFYDRSNVAYKEALEKFKAESEKTEGEEQEEFDYNYPYTNAFKAVLKTYKTRRDAFYGDQEKQMASNLKIKLDLIEELKGLLNAEEKMKETFEHFKDIQERWKSAGQVPKSELNNLWQTYHHHVENFFDYLRINNDLRDIEFKRNLEQKTALCDKAEALDTEDNLDKAFSTLQALHESWKEVGPVGRDHRESIWERFQAATKVIHKKRNDFYEKRKESYEENFQQKLAMCEQVEAIDYSELTHHNKWQKQSDHINTLREDWKKVGPISREQNDESWTRFITAIKTFNAKKNDFYKDLKKGQKDNLAIKQAIVEKAEALADSTDWKETANILKKLQSDWKKSGMAPKKEADALWNRLRTACNTFFDNLKKQHEVQDKEFEANLAVKQEFLKEVEAFKNSGNTKEDIETIKGFINSWKNMGRVPRKSVKAIEGTFRGLIDSFFEQLDMDKAEKRDIQFKTRIEAIVAEDDEAKLNEELYKLQQNAKKCKEELTLLENNINFFRNAKDDNPLLKEVRKNIEKQKEKLDEIKSRMAYIRSL
jgi:hypothetical protein